MIVSAFSVLYLNCTWCSYYLLKQKDYHYCMIHIPLHCVPTTRYSHFGLLGEIGI